MIKITRWALLFLFLLILCSCNQQVLTKKELITTGVTVLLPEKFEKLDNNDGQILYNSNVGTSSFRVFVINNMQVDTLGLDKIKEGMERNVTRFIEPMKGKILQRRDTIIGKIVQSDFEFEIITPEATKCGAGRFVVQGNNFIGFIFETISPETPTGKTLRESFLNSVQIEQ
jgi:hypothetical protein